MGKHTPRPRACTAWSCLKNTPFCNQPQVWLIARVSFWLLRAPLVSSGTAAHTAGESHHQCGVHS
ncbi:unnamed protein product [Staurois parvus]|uniref:Uncharacterized protein n=1 Tax=Staurois parvus TaxID=386267 RepID=A0ABN9H8M8_9NEOB|nr:unnamed protein product [Staurois parvus]